eukprot:TRINITY_DN1554_c0_g1_i1.p1 TRINITY_DN1554_c0_g1~~TRINITY_DN1554_c0_g1_i1.p1  ORF type:complete len:125 (+),score=18.59 TRINITY_DN1554_c0_g1_i1:282-656(+)
MTSPNTNDTSAKNENVITIDGYWKYSIFAIVAGHAAKCGDTNRFIIEDRDIVGTELGGGIGLGQTHHSTIHSQSVSIHPNLCQSSIIHPKLITSSTIHPHSIHNQSQSIPISSKSKQCPAVRNN